MKHEYLRKIPSVNKLLKTGELQEVLKEFPQDLVVDFINKVLAEKRNKILQGEIYPELMDFSLNELAKEVKKVLLNYMAPRLKEVINATGTILHTNLGRAVLSEKAVEALARIAKSYSNLEYDLEEGFRGSRYELVTDLLCNLTGAEDALVVNNNASAVLLILNTLAKGKEVIISRGEIVEIGGSFRIHEVMKTSGCNLVEVGSTNKTHLYDYEEAITPETAMLLKVHTSNYKIVGFSKQIESSELVMLGNKYGIPVYEDLGSGVLIDLVKYGISHEPTVQEMVRAGVDIISFSGDKLLGGPQAGIIVGKKKYIKSLKKNHLLRALRVDKFTLAALEATLKHYLKEEEALEKIPTLRMLTLSGEELRLRLENFKEKLLSEVFNGSCRIIEDFSMVGGGSLPLEKIPTYLLGIRFYGISTTDASIKLRKRNIPIICRIQEDELLLDFRTVFAFQENELLKALKEVVES